MAASTHPSPPEPAVQRAGFSRSALIRLPGRVIHRALTELSRSWRKTRRRLFFVSEEDIRHVLARLGTPPGGKVMVHSSLSGCGTIEGGAETVIRALQEWVSGGLLVMPTHTYCYPDSTETAPIYDPGSTPSLVGAITDLFWRLPGVVRSLHPTHSLAASGRGAEWLCAGHEDCETPCGAGTPYMKLVDEDASVLMFAASLDTYTLFHTAEDAAAVPYLYERDPYELSFIRPDGGVSRGVARGVSRIVTKRQDMGVPRRFTRMARWMEQRELLRRETLGGGALLYIPRCGAAHQALTAALRDDPYLLVDPKFRARQER